MQLVAQMLEHPRGRTAIELHLDEFIVARLINQRVERSLISATLNVISQLSGSTMDSLRSSVWLRESIFRAVGFSARPRCRQSVWQHIRHTNCHI
jgi:hypothetical protein